MLKNNLNSTEIEQIKKTINSIDAESKVIFLSTFIECLAENDPNVCKNIFNFTKEKLEGLKNLHELETLANVSFSKKDITEAIALFEANRQDRLKKVFGSFLRKARIVSEKNTLKENLSKTEEKVRQC